MTITAIPEKVLKSFLVGDPFDSKLETSKSIAPKVQSKETSLIWPIKEISPLVSGSNP